MKKKNKKGILAFFIAMIMLVGLLPLSVAAEDWKPTHFAMKANVGVGAEEICVFPIEKTGTINSLSAFQGGTVAYCFNKTRAFPDMFDSYSGIGGLQITAKETATYRKSEDVSAGFFKEKATKANEGLTDEELRSKVISVAANGYPKDRLGLKDKYDFNDSQLNFITQVAVWYYTDNNQINDDASIVNALKTSGLSFSGEELANGKKAVNELINSDLELGKGKIDGIDLYLTEVENGDEENPKKFQNLLSINLGDFEFPELPTTQTGSIKISKEITGLETDRKFTFIISSEKDTLQLIGHEPTDVEFNIIADESGKDYGYFKLGHNESITLNGLLYGDYFIKELEGNQFGIKVNDKPGGEFGVRVNLSSDAVQNEVKFTNTRQTKSLKIKKLVKGTEDYIKENESVSFPVRISFKGDAIPINKLSCDGASIYDVDEKNNSITINLKHNQIAEIKEIPLDLLYKVEELNASGYNVSYTYSDTESTEEGWYYILEPVQDFNVPKVDIDVPTVDIDGSGSIADVIITNSKKTPPPGPKEITLSKQDIHGNELKGATITLTRDGETEPKDTWVSDGTKHTFTLEEAGKYILKETAAPEGYKIASKITFTIDEDGKITECDAETKTYEESLIVMVDGYDLEKRELELSKQDIYGKELKGATITLTKTGADKPLETWESDGTKHSFKLDGAGEYVLEETAAPEGHIIASKITFTVDETGKITSKNAEVKGDKENYIVMVDDFSKDYKDVILSKQDIDGDELKGATIVLKDKATGKEITEWISDGTKYTFKVKPGEYVFEETAAPKGYKIASSITFKVDKDGKVTVDGKEVSGDTNNLIVMVDGYDEKYKDVIFSKQNVKGEELKGATITITKVGEDKPLETWESDGTPHKFRLEPGEYVFKETAAPEGYKIASSIYFKVAEDGKVTTTDVVVMGAKGNMIVMVDNYKTTPDTPETPPETPDRPELPNPNEPNSPDTVVIEEEGVPKTYRKVPNPDEPGEYLYMLDEDIPLAGATPTGDYNNVLYAGIAGLSLLGIAILLKRKRMEVK